MPRAPKATASDIAIEPRRSSRISSQPKLQAEPKKAPAKPRSKKAATEGEAPKGRKRKTADKEDEDGAPDEEPPAKKTKPASKTSKPASKAAVAKPASKASRAGSVKPASRAVSAKPASTTGKKPASRAGSKKPSSKVEAADKGSEKENDAGPVPETIAEEPEDDAAAEPGQPEFTEATEHTEA